MVSGKEPLTVNQRWVKQAKGTYDFDVTKADKLFEFLVKEGRIKLPESRIKILRVSRQEFSFHQ
jgi:hypothetical protein